MKLRVLVTIVLLGVVQAAGAVRVIKPLERAAEVSLINLNLPREETGRITFRSCAACRLRIHRLEPNTAFRLNGAPVDFQTFRDAIADARKGNAVVFLDLETNRVRRVSASTH